MHASVCSCVDFKVLMRTVEELTSFTRSKNTYHLECYYGNVKVLSNQAMEPCVTTKTCRSDEKKLGDDLIKMHTLLVLKVLVCTVEEWISVDEVETHTNAFTS